jgi:hypothetical protein
MPGRINERRMCARRQAPMRMVTEHATTPHEAGLRWQASTAKDKS